MRCSGIVEFDKLSVKFVEPAYQNELEARKMKVLNAGWQVSAAADAYVVTEPSAPASRLPPILPSPLKTKFCISKS